MKSHIAILLLSILCLNACISHKKATVRKKAVSLEPVTVSAKNSEYRAAATHTWDIVHSRVELSFNYKEKTANGKEWISVHPYVYPSDTLVLDAKSMQIEVVEVTKGKEVLPTSYYYVNDKLCVYPGKTSPKDTLLVYIQYTAMPYAKSTGGSSAIVDDRGLYFINTDNAIAGKPQQIWTQGETESNSHWLPTIDKPNERFTTRIELIVPDTMQTLSNGYWGASLREKNHMRKDIWVMDKPIQAYAIMFAIGRFDMTKDEWHGREISYYTEHEYTRSARRIFRYTPEMVDYFSNITGVPYPWIKYSQIVVRDYVSGAMENTSATLLGEFLNETPRELLDRDFEDVVSHELFHQWFGDYVTCESWSNITLNESFANYGEQLWRRYKHGDAEADKLAYEDLQKYLAYVSYTADSPLVRYYYNDREDVFDPISYEKGGAILHYLQSLVGDSVFYSAMKIYLTKNALQSGEVAMWRQAIEEATGQDWNWFFNQWYFHAGHPIIQLSYKYDDSAQQMKVTITQSDTTGYVYRLPLKCTLLYGDKRMGVDIELKKKTETLIYPYSEGQKPVFIFDEKRCLPGGYTDNKKPWALLAQYKYSNTYASKRIALTYAQNKFADSSNNEIVKLALHDTMPGIKEYCLQLIRWVKDNDLVKKWEPEVSMLAYTDSKNAVRAAAFDVLGTWKITSAKEEMQKAVYDSSYMVAGSALDGLFAIDSVSAYTIVMKDLIKSDPHDGLASSISGIIGKTAKDEDAWYFENAAKPAYGTNKFVVAQGLYYYLLRVQSDVSFEKGVKVITDLVMNDGIKSYRIGLAGYLVSIKDEYASRKKKGERKEEAERRIQILQHYLDKIIAAETDEGNLKRYKEMMK